MSDLGSSTFILEDGDGDPDWLHERHIVEHVSSDGFSGLSGDWYGNALLFRVVGPNHEGEIIALSPRTVGEIPEQLKTNGFASVIVHRFACEETVLRSGEASSSSAIGMTILHSDHGETSES